MLWLFKDTILYRYCRFPQSFKKKKIGQRVIKPTIVILSAIFSLIYEQNWFLETLPSLLRFYLICLSMGVFIYLTYEIIHIPHKIRNKREKDEWKKAFEAQTCQENPSEMEE